MFRHLLTWSIALALGAFAGPSAGFAQTIARVPVARPALDGVFSAFEQHRLVALGDAHHLAQAGAFYAALVEDPRFAETVGNIVWEAGGASHQGTVDRYVDGEAVPYHELRRVWTDVVGWEAPPSQMYSNLLAVVRAVNAGLPPNKRIRVILGEPPIDWTKIKSFSDLEPLMAQRDSHPAALIEREILRRGKKALVVYGTGHFLFSPLGPNLKELIEQAHPNSVYLIAPYAGYARPTCSEQLEARAKDWRPPVLIAPIAGTWIEDLMTRCAGAAGFRSPDPEKMARARAALSGASADALIYYGSEASLTFDAADQSLYLDPDYLNEWNRSRSCCFPAGAQIISDQILQWNTRSPRRYEPK